MISFFMIFFFSFFWFLSISSFLEFLTFWMIHFFLFTFFPSLIINSFICLYSKIPFFLMVMQMLSSFFIFLSFSIEKNNYKLLNFFLWSMIWSIFFFFFTDNIFLFFLSFESTMFPIILMVYGWGYQVERIKSMLYMFFYLLFSVFPSIICIGILFMNNMTSFFMNFFLSSNFFSLLICLPFFIKLPIFFFHNWLILAHVEAPAFGSVFLAAVLLKTGGFGLYKINFFFPLTNCVFFILMFLLLSLFLSCLVMIFQSDLKAWIAFSSITHMTLCSVCFFLYSSFGFSIFLISLFSHAFTSALLFFLAHIIQYGFLTRNIYFLSGISFLKSSLSFLLISSIFLNLGFPFSLNFFTEVIGVANLFFFFKTFGMFVSFIMIICMIILSIFICSSIFHGKFFLPIFKVTLTYFISLVFSLFLCIIFFMFLWAVFLNLSFSKYFSYKEKNESLMMKILPFVSGKLKIFMFMKKSNFVNVYI